MNKIITFAGALFILSCRGPQKISAVSQIPDCVENQLKEMAQNPAEGTPQSVTRYTYKGRTVYYFVAACCDKYNRVLDDSCQIIGFPDGGYTGKGDGKMTDFHKEATDKKLIWEYKKDQNEATMNFFRPWTKWEIYGMGN